ncbi:granulin b isoform 1-T2 [Spinachia spinachia]
MLPTGVVFLALLGLSSTRVCPDGGICRYQNTCCKNTVGGYGCCPLPYAECCSDHLHCCYERTVCDLVHSRCVNKTVSLPMMTRIPQLQDALKAVICPDHESECPNDATCCQFMDGSWGCCPLTKAVCCEDKLHCCPEDTKCDLAHSKCVSSSLESFPMLEKLPARRRDNHSVALQLVGSVSCPGGKSSCPDSYTCCLLASGDYGCCPYSQAMCCSDHLHCCPSNTICDLAHGVCKDGDAILPLLKKIAAVPNDFRCPDKTSLCPDQTTCCKMADGSYGCCPMPNAVCCSDHIHCCPEGTQCDVAQGTCLSARREGALTSVAVTTPMEVPKKVSAVPCNESVACADETTCCKLAEGGWACCPLPKAVCCEDHQHCCPHGTICDLEASTCVDSSAGTSTPWLDKLPAFPLPTGNSQCDKTTSCPGKSTCCRTGGGGWACCPLPEAVCCEDHLHCCPHGTVCNLPAETCDDPSGVLSSRRWVEKASAARAVAIPTLPARNMCDAQTSCPRDTTCCFMDQTHKWGCCPLPKAVCCQDGDHCCPSGHTCEPHRSSCSRGPLVLVPWFSKLSARSEAAGKAAVTDVKCDNKSSCASGTTCCKLQTGGWGCCPLVKAVCCADREHCCPQGYTCNMQTGTCEKKTAEGLPLPLPQVRVVRPEAGDHEDVACDVGGEFRCPGRHTCCRVSASEWGCCPSPGAICCPDSKHCCPAGYSCDPKAGGCSPQMTWDRKSDFVPHGL